MPVGQLALTIAVVFAGAAIYITIAGQPARLQLDNRSPRRVEPGLQAGDLMQASLAVVGGLFGLVAYLGTLHGR